MRSQCRQYQPPPVVPPRLAVLVAMPTPMTGAYRSAPETPAASEQGWQMRALLRLVDRRQVRAGRRVGLRDAAVLLLRAARLSPTELSRLCGRDVEQDPAGRVFVCLHPTPQGEPSVRRVRVPDVSDAYVHSILLDYLEAERLWGRPDPLFRGPRGMALGASAIRMIELKYRRRLDR